MYSYDTCVESFADREELESWLKQVRRDGWELDTLAELGTRRADERTTYRIRLRTKGIPVDRLSIYNR